MVKKCTKNGVLACDYAKTPQKGVNNVAFSDLYKKALLFHFNSSFEIAF